MVHRGHSNGVWQGATGSGAQGAQGVQGATVIYWTSR